jgi:hypothetical protein
MTHFFDLPPELRQIIYRDAFPHGSIFYVTNNRQKWSATLSNGAIEHVPGFLFASKETLADAGPTFYGENTFDSHKTTHFGNFYPVLERLKTRLNTSMLWMHAFNFSYYFRYPAGKRCMGCQHEVEWRLDIEFNNGKLKGGMSLSKWHAMSCTDSGPYLTAKIMKDFEEVYESFWEKMKGTCANAVKEDLKFMPPRLQQLFERRY